MEQLQMREKVIAELRGIPDEKMEKIYEYIRLLQIEPQNSKTNADKIMGFAGCWSDMPDNAFSDFIQEVKDRRAQAFAGRRENETGAN
jgi:hypothetical protein